MVKYASFEYLTSSIDLTCFFIILLICLCHIIYNELLYEFLVVCLGHSLTLNKYGAMNQQILTLLCYARIMSFIYIYIHLLLH